MLLMEEAGKHGLKTRKR